ncbi:unnamed protein product [Paramecium sonneborni]|uniref:EF-hand domain-containing protein n=1 Tax=Paramecium sonneborni TaxID=65129 RepID=A0A8S1P2A0_9CILI|nr:unnamed protein product [Paramecium sonneborni]CAD8095324.1 unnamed protein product [Paramecium sonneborni]
MFKLRTHTVKQWLLQRFHKSVNSQYIIDPKEEEYKQELAQLFAKFDQEGKGEIQKYELLTLLNKYGISINEQELTAYIKQANPKSGRFITTEQFKQCVLSEKSKLFLKKLINKSNERNPQNYFPTDITKVLNQVHYLSERGRLLSQIEDKLISNEQKLQPLSRLMNLSREITIAEHKPQSKYPLRLPRAKSTSTTNYNSISTAITLPSTSNSRFGDNRISFRKHPTQYCE